MYLINRAVAIIKPKQPLVDWINGYPGAEGLVTLGQAREDCTVILLPEYYTEDEAYSFIEEICSELFEIELHSWYVDENYWPTNRDYQTFMDWFEIEIHSMVLDPFEEEIEKEEFYG
jgi:hypothetical protein